jgi:hypothetical protein
VGGDQWIIPERFKSIADCLAFVRGVSHHLEMPAPEFSVRVTAAHQRVTERKG